jgi:mono/diheme cytochrome c family protein
MLTAPPAAAAPAPAAPRGRRGPPPGAPPIDQELPQGVTAEMVAQGEELFRGRANCFTCHGMDGAGTQLGPDLTDDTWINIERRDMAQIETVIRTGVDRPVQYPAPMPPMGGARLDDDEIRAVAAYTYLLSAR